MIDRDKLAEIIADTYASEFQDPAGRAADAVVAHLSAVPVEGEMNGHDRDDMSVCRNCGQLDTISDRCARRVAEAGL